MNATGASLWNYDIKNVNLKNTKKNANFASGFAASFVGHIQQQASKENILTALQPTFLGKATFWIFLFSRLCYI